MEKEGLVATFCEITSGSKEEALFFLESHNWNLDSAVSTFLEEDSNHNPIPNLNNPNFQSSSPSSSPSQPLPLQQQPPQIPVFQSSVPMASRPDKKPVTKPSGNRRGGIRTLSDLNRPSGPDSDSDSDGPQEYYTGGEKSGMLVQDPTRGGRGGQYASREVKFLLNISLAPCQPEVPIYKIVDFTNCSCLQLGSLSDRIEVLNLGPSNGDDQAFCVALQLEVYLLMFLFLDTMQSIKKSECPKELEPADRRSSVHVNLIRREGNGP
ncbi:hypothetical protein MKW92_053340, partial [Papaver armeniacum]